MSLKDKLYNTKKLADHIPDNYKLPILKALPKLSPELQDAVFTTACFGYLFIDEGETCPYVKECELAKPCESVYRTVNNLTKKGLKQIQGLVPPERHKHAGTGKYQRYGYRPKERPIDEFVNAFLENLKPFTELPQHWNKANFKATYGLRKKIFVSRAASYHAIVINELDKSGIIAMPEICCRVWTNAASNPLIDLNEELSTYAADKFVLFPPPENSSKKMLPCTWRTKLVTPEDAAKLAKCIRDLYG